MGFFFAVWNITVCSGAVTRLLSNPEGQMFPQCKTWPPGGTLKKPLKLLMTPTVTSSTSPVLSVCSEIRLMEIIEDLCDSSSFDCNHMLEEHEDKFETWWFKKWVMISACCSDSHGFIDYHVITCTGWSLYCSFTAADLWCSLLWNYWSFYCIILTVKGSYLIALCVWNCNNTIAPLGDSWIITLLICLLSFINTVRRTPFYYLYVCLMGKSI